MSSAERPGRRLLAVLALAVLPWSVQTFRGGAVTFLFPWGLVTVPPLHVTTLADYLFVYTAGLPDYILAWPTSVLLYALALASASAGLLDREDPRVTGGLLALVGVAQLSVAWGFSVQPARTAWPTGTLACWAVAWRCYRPLVGR
ncbi:MAG: TIGR04206 family protein [Haloferacaceae archaeon]